MNPPAKIPVKLQPDEFAASAVHHRERILRFALAFLGNLHRAEDVVQEGFRKLYEHRDEYPLDTLFGPYLMKTVARMCIDLKRKDKTEERRYAELALPAPADPAWAAERRETSDLIASAIGQLPERERACFLLTVCEGQSYVEAGDALSLTFGEVNGAVHRARLLLRASLASLITMGRKREET